MSSHWSDFCASLKLRPNQSYRGKHEPPSKNCSHTPPPQGARVNPCAQLLWVTRFSLDSLRSRASLWLRLWLRRARRSPRREVRAQAPRAVRPRAGDPGRRHLRAPHPHQVRQEHSPPLPYLRDWGPSGLSAPAALPPRRAPQPGLTRRGRARIGCAPLRTIERPAAPARPAGAAQVPEPRARHGAAGRAPLSPWRSW